MIKVSGSTTNVFLSEIFSAHIQIKKVIPIGKLCGATILFYTTSKTLICRKLNLCILFLQTRKQQDIYNLSKFKDNELQYQYFL